MSLKERLKQRNIGLVRREKITLPDSGEAVRVRGLMLEERTRVGEKTGFAAVATMIALAVEDPDSGELVFNANDMFDWQIIGTFSGPDSDLIVDTVMRLSGMNKAGREEVGKESPESGSSSSSSQPVTVFLPQELEQS